MGEFFELVLFGEWSCYLYWNYEVVWWGINSISTQDWNKMEKLRNMTVKLDIALCARGGILGCGSGRVVDKRVLEDTGIRNAIEATYRKLDIQPKPLSAQLKTNLWSVNTVDSDYFDFEAFLRN
jgi:hypothetical protein